MSRLLIADAKLVNVGILQDADVRIRGLHRHHRRWAMAGETVLGAGARPDAGYDRRSDALSRAPHAGLSA